MEHFTFDVRGGGMGFLLRYGDKVRVLRAPVESFRMGDLIVFLSGWHGVEREKRLAVHRLLFKTRDGAGWRLWAKGDAFWRLDSPIPEACVLGKVEAISRDGGASWTELDSPLNGVRHRVLGLAFGLYSLCRKGLSFLSAGLLLVLIMGAPPSRASAGETAALQADQKLAAARDADWAKLEHLLTLSAIPQEDKERWSAEFLKLYWKSPGLESAMADALEAYVTDDAMRDALETRATQGKAGIVWVRIPGGNFTMGSADPDLAESRPEHRVTVKSFRMAKTLATNKQYKICVSAGVCTPAKSFGPDFEGDEQPVVGVNWDQARVFSEWAGGRLPSEAEWEYAARGAGKDFKYPWGEGVPNCGTAVVNGCGEAATAPVCSKPAGDTPQALCDMAGDAWEWVQDSYHASYAGAPENGGAWEDAGPYRVNRGGSWRDEAGLARAAYRLYYAAGNRSDYLGFRPAR